MKSISVYKREDCRVCRKEQLSIVFNFGPTPLANTFLTKQKIDLPEYYYPLEVFFCQNCGFIQLGHIVASQILFKDYVYVSSTSPVFVEHFNRFAKEVFDKFDLGAKSLVIDIGSNDGILLKPFGKLGAKVLGIEPAEHIAKQANKEGIRTIAEFFDSNLAKKIVGKYGNAKIVTATNVFAHIDDLDEVVKGVDYLLEKEGVFIIEAPYLIDFLEKRYFDLVYHEHMSYWSVGSLVKIFNRFDMEVFDVKKVATHGGSIRVFIKKKGASQKTSKKNVNYFLSLEKRKNLTKKETYDRFAKLVQINKIKLLTTLAKIKSRGKSVAAYGAPAKGNTLLNFFSIGTETLDFVVDDSPFKQGLYSPGKHIPVVSSEEMYKKNPDYILILAWNFASAIMEKHKKYQKEGGRFIIPVPVPKVI